MIPTIFVIISPILSFIGGAAYIKDTLKGKTKPNRVSFFLWALAPIIGTAITLSNGAGWEVVPVFMAGFMPLIIFIVSFINKNSYWRLGKIDYICFVLAIITMVLWLAADKPLLALSFAIATDLFAYFPTFIKSYKYPETETALLYILPTFGNIFGILVAKDWVFVSIGFSLYLIIANTVNTLFIYRRKLFLKTI
ncbi:MAG: hypothetical protein R3B64_00015 [Candidatus Paceibacterota bacterium]